MIQATKDMMAVPQRPSRSGESAWQVDCHMRTTTSLPTTSSIKTPIQSSPIDAENWRHSKHDEKRGNNQKNCFGDFSRCLLALRGNYQRFS